MNAFLLTLVLLLPVFSFANTDSCTLHNTWDAQLDEQVIDILTQKGYSLAPASESVNAQGVFIEDSSRLHLVITTSSVSNSATTRLSCMSLSAIPFERHQTMYMSIVQLPSLQTAPIALNSRASAEFLVCNDSPTAQEIDSERATTLSELAAKMPACAGLSRQ